jgi:hypothetical protein
MTKFSALIKALKQKFSRKSFVGELPSRPVKSRHENGSLSEQCVKFFGEKIDNMLL